MSLNKYDAWGRIVYHIPDNSLVLDVGCSKGHVAKLLCEKNCDVTGIEINKNDSEFAKRYCSKVIVGDVETLDTLPFPVNYFDVILFGDILEHLKNPEKTLKKFVLYLKNEGRIVASMPNVANWAIRLNLLFGRFDYQENGILSKYHLRFFTLKTIKQLFNNAGLKIIEVDVTPGLHLLTLYNALIGRLLSKIPGYDLFTYSLTKLFKTFFSQQFIVIAKKCNIEKMKMSQ